MGYVHSQTGSGLILAQDGMDVAAVERALRRHDPRLEVQGHPTLYGRDLRILWKVFARLEDGSLAFVYAHQLDDLTPLPLSSSIVDAVQQHDPNTRGRARNVDQETARLKAEHEKDARDWGDAIVQEFEKKLDGKKSSPLPRSRSLYMARIRMRAKQHRDFWS